MTMLTLTELRTSTGVSAGCFTDGQADNEKPNQSIQEQSSAPSEDLWTCFPEVVSAFYSYCFNQAVDVLQPADGHR